MCVYASVCVWACVRACFCVFVRLCACINMCACARACLLRLNVVVFCTSVCLYNTCVCACVRLHEYVYVCVYMYIYIYMCVCVCVCVRSSVFYVFISIFLCFQDQYKKLEEKIADAQTTYAVLSKSAYNNKSKTYKWVKKSHPLPMTAHSLPLSIFTTPKEWGFAVLPRSQSLCG